MKVSRYNQFFTSGNDGKWFAFNAMTEALATLDEEKYHLVKTILNDPNQIDRTDEAVRELWDDLVRGGYLVEDWIDELKILQIRNRTARFQNYGLGLTIVPTMNCNFQCPYCFETHPNQVMSQEVENALVELLRNRLRPQETLCVTWFGGEPLLRLKQILRLTERFDEICQERESSYSASIVTNGYLLSEKAVQELLTAHVDRVQVTLDGPREMHDRTRRLHNGQGTYDRIMANLEALVNGNHNNGEGERRVRGSVRVNVDKTNIAEIPLLLDDLTRRGLKGKIGVFVGQLRPYTEACNHIGGSCFGDDEYPAIEVDLYRQFLERGFQVTRYPRARSAYCMADSCQNAFLVAPGGELYGCWTDIGSTNIIGHLLDQGEERRLYPRLIEYLSWDPFEQQECRECDILPICMGGCPYLGYQQGLIGRGFCDLWKDNLLEMLRLYYISVMRRRQRSAEGADCTVG